VILDRERQTPGFNGEAFVEGVLRDMETSDLTPKEKALFRFVDKVNLRAPEIRPDDIHALHASGWDDAAIYYAITICALFNFYNRWVDASGVHALSSAAHRAQGRRSAETGYVKE
jgi:hypothetical protein